MRAFYVVFLTLSSCCISSLSYFRHGFVFVLGVISHNLGTHYILFEQNIYVSVERPRKHNVRRKGERRQIYKQ